MGRYICENCGPSQDSFRGRQEFSDYGTEEIFFDSQGDIQDYGDKDVNDSEAGEWHDIECRTCGARALYVDGDDVAPGPEETLKNRFEGIL